MATCNAQRGGLLLTATTEVMFLDRDFDLSLHIFVRGRFKQIAVTTLVLDKQKIPDWTVPLKVLRLNDFDI